MDGGKAESHADSDPNAIIVPVVLVAVALIIIVIVIVIAFNRRKMKRLARFVYNSRREEVVVREGNGD